MPGRQLGDLPKMIQPPLLGVVNAASAVSARTLTWRAPAVPRSCDGPVGEDRGKAAPAGVKQTLRAANMQKAIVLPGEGSHWADPRRSQSCAPRPQRPCRISL